MVNKIPSQYISIVKKSLVAVVAVDPAGILGGLDTVAIGATWHKDSEHRSCSRSREG